MRRLCTIFVMFLSLVRTGGLLQALRFSLVSVATSPRLWERLLTRKLMGSRLRKMWEQVNEFGSADLVSVVLPVNNGRSKGVERLVESLKDQTHKDMEFIAVDSGSTDDTVPYLRSQGFKVIEIPSETFSHDYSRNLGAEHAQGAYLLFVVDDAVFHDTNWVTYALFLLTYFDADSFSSTQVIDGDADAYATLLSFFLANSQSDRPSVNISRNNWFCTMLRRVLPFRSQVRSVAIDDTNHLVRKEAFDRIKFGAPTVEDIDFALRLTRAGGRTMYTNLISITHYHQFDLSKIQRYAKRIFLDCTQISRWEQTYFRMTCRDVYMVGAFHVLAKMFLALANFEKSHLRTTEQLLPLSRASIERILALVEDQVNKGIRLIGDMGDAHYVKARETFRSICGNDPPPDLFVEIHVFFSFAHRYLYALRGIREGYYLSNLKRMNMKEFETVAVYLWCQQVMSTVADRRNFSSVNGRYEFDSWTMSSWN
jgi:glycosyltransferase involved in cell wall biosynthesis